LKDEQSLTHPRCFETNSFASLANSQLYGTANDPALGCTFRLTFADEKSSLGPETIPAFVADKAALMPLATNGGDDYVVQDVLLAA